MKDHPRILLAEDNAGDVFFIRRALDRHLKSYELQVAPDGREALSVLKHIEAGVLPVPDIVLLDLNLPGIHGGKVLSYLKTSPKLTDVPVIVATSSDASLDRADAMQQGAGYFKKPIDVTGFMKIGELVVNTLRKGSDPGGAPL